MIPDDILNLVIYTTAEQGMSYYDEDWNLYAVQQKVTENMSHILIGFQGIPLERARLDWLPWNWTFT